LRFPGAIPVIKRLIKNEPKDNYSTAFVVGILSVLYIAGNVIARNTIEERLTKAIGLRTRIAGFWISPWQRKISIKNFTIANPEGFSDEPLFRLKSCSAFVTLSTLRRTSFILNQLSCGALPLLQSTPGIASTLIL